MAKNIDMPANIREIIEKYGENYMGVLKFGTDEEKKNRNEMVRRHDSTATR